MDMERSCGAVVFTRREGKILYLIVQGMSGTLGFPKGHMEAGETEEETARREIFEETGLEPVFLEGFWETEEYPLPKKNFTPKQVTYFLAEFFDETPLPRFGEIAGISLLPYEEAEKRLTRDGTRRVLKKADAYLKGLAAAAIK